MKNQRWIGFLAPLGLTLALSCFGVGTTAPDTTVPAVGQKAGKITALLPTAHVVRGGGKKAVTTDAVKGEDLIWQDLVKTDKGGRARITLNDQSILSLGSQAELRIVKHDARTQQTALEMTYGRIRAQVATVTREGGSFSLRTPTAVAGVIGTDFGTDASEPGLTTFVCISGMVQIGNADPGVPGTVPCAPGQTTTVKSGMPPTPPQTATQQQINQLITDTEPATISAFAPASALIGTTVDAVATGMHMSGFSGVTVAGASGVQASLGPNGTDTSVTAHIVVATTAEPGPRTITFAKPNGANTAAVFTVIAPPSLRGIDGASLKKRYTDILTAELQAADGSNASIKSSLQQEVDQGLQTIQQNNGKLPQPISTNQVSQQLANLVTNFAAAGADRATQAYNTAGNAVDAIVAAMLPKIQDGSEPTGNVATDLDTQFAPINQVFQTALSQIHTDFAAQAASQIQSVDQLVSGFQQNITTAAQQELAPPMPKTDSQERTVEAGFQTSFDASGSTALGGASIASLSWVLCDSSYKPSQVGVVLPPNTAPCKAISGFAASGGQFQFNTCGLSPAEYVARVTVTDTNGKTSAMDVRLHVIAPGYDDPSTRLQSLAAAYVSLQSSQFLSFFDPTYAGYTQLQENIRNTFLSLSSMQINLRVSQANITCNEATLRADWDQKYTFKGDQTCANATPGGVCQKLLFTQSEQLTARLTRVPGKGWFITDFQGDNGTVQGVPPGPQTTFVAQPSLQITGLELKSSSSHQQIQKRQGAANSSSPSQTIGIAAGVNRFVATVTNIGDAPLTQQPQLRFSLTDSSGSEITGDTEDLPTLPLNPGDSESVTGSLNVPTFAAATPVTVGGNVNPGCKVQEQTCGSKNALLVNAIAGADFNVTNNLGLAGDLNVQVGSQGGFTVSLAAPQGLPGGNADVAVSPAIQGVTYGFVSPLAVGSSDPIVVQTNSSAPAGTSVPIIVTGTNSGVSHSATQSVRFFTASLENFSAGQPGSSSNQPIILPVNGAAQPLSIRLSGNFFNPGGGAQLIFPTSTGISITPSATTAAAGDIVTLQIQAVQGASVNQTIPLTIKAQIPNMNPPIPQILTIFVRPTALPDLAVTGVAVASRNFTTNPWLSGEPLDFVVTVTNTGPGASQGFESLHLMLNGMELTRGLTVPQVLQPNSSVNVTVHLVAPDPVFTGSSTVTAKVDEDLVGDANPSNDLLAVPVATSDWGIGINSGLNVGDSDANALMVAAGGSNTTLVAPKLTGSGDFLSPVSVLNGIVSSRLTATPGLSSFSTTQQQIRYSISASSTAAQGFYAAQVIARFVDRGRNTAQRQATVHISVLNPNSLGDQVTVTSNRNNACAASCTPVEINGLLIENLNLTVTRSGGTVGSVDLHFTDPSSVISNVTSSGTFQNPIINGVPYAVATNVFFAAAQDATGAVLPGTAQVTVSATSVQTSAVRDGPTPQPVATTQMLQFGVGDIQLSSEPCFNLSPGSQGVLQLNFTPLGGFNVPSISWSVTALPAGVSLNSVTPSSTFNGSSYSAVNVSLTNNNPVDIAAAQPLTLVGSITNNNGSASVAFAPTVQLHSGACLPGGVRNAMGAGGISGNRGVWRRGVGSGALARTAVMQQQISSLADVRLIPGDVTYTPALPKAGDTVQLRFRLTNSTPAAARDVPVALVVNGAVVASDTFDVAAGKTVLGGLQWVNAQPPRTLAGRSSMTALVVDPERNVRATVASGKIVPLTHFALEGGALAAASFASRSLSGHQRAVVQIAESACIGFRFSSGADGACSAADVEVSLEDAAAGVFSLASTRGISDLGISYAGGNVAASVPYTSQVVAAAGHSYAVQLDGGRVGVLTIRSINNPQHRVATANKVFRGGAARKLAARLGKTGEPVETGDVSGATSQHGVSVLELLYDIP